FMRSPSPPSGAFDQIQCVLRPVGTYGVSPAEVGVVELRQDMTTAGQGNETNGRGFNVPSLLGLQTGAPYFHAGNARTLEELLSSTFDAHTKALNGVLALSPTQIDALVAYLLSIDESTAPLPLPAVGSQGGTFCSFP